MITTQGPHEILVKTLLSSYSLLVMSIEEEIQPLTIMWIPLEVGCLNGFKDFSSEPSNYGVKSILDDMMIILQWLEVLNVRFNIFYCI